MSELGCILADLEAFLPCFHVGSCDLIKPIIGIDQLLDIAAVAHRHSAAAALGMRKGPWDEQIPLG